MSAINSTVPCWLDADRTLIAGPPPILDTVSSEVHGGGVPPGAQVLISEEGDAFQVEEGTDVLITEDS